MKSKIEYFECSCHSPEHSIKFILDNDKYGTDLYIYTQLNVGNNIFRRIWLGIKYIFGYDKKYGHWEETILKEEDVDKIIDLLNEYKKLKGQ